MAAEMAFTGGLSTVITAMPDSMATLIGVLTAKKLVQKGGPREMAVRAL